VARWSSALASASCSPSRSRASSNISGDLYALLIR
jgi:hypothetical protein